MNDPVSRDAVFTAILPYIFAGSFARTPYFNVNWMQEQQFKYKLKISPHPYYHHVVKTALVCKGAIEKFREHIKAQIWHDSAYAWNVALCIAMNNCNFQTWEGWVPHFNTSRFSLYLHDTFFGGTTLTYRPSDTDGVYELVARYGIAENDAEEQTTYVATMPSGLAISTCFRTDEQLHEIDIWYNREREALGAFLAARHLMHGIVV
jgi:hypothetical protein